MEKTKDNNVEELLKPRVIKFRGKRVDNGELAHGYLVVIEGKYMIVPIAASIRIIATYDKRGCFGEVSQDGSEWACEVDEKTVGQFTGLCDKNGKEIYQGDILKNTTGETGPVVWHNAGFHLECKRRNDTYFYIPLDEGMLKNKEVVGNIFQNPELLK